MRRTSELVLAAPPSQQRALAATTAEARALAAAVPAAGLLAGATPARPPQKQCLAGGSHVSQRRYKARTLTTKGR